MANNNLQQLKKQRTMSSTPSTRIQFSTKKREGKTMKIFFQDKRVQPFQGWSVILPFYPRVATRGK
jgi:hypothetical protein